MDWTKEPWDTGTKHDIIIILLQPCKHWKSQQVLVNIHLLIVYLLHYNYACFSQWSTLSPSIKVCIYSRFTDYVALFNNTLPQQHTTGLEDTNPLGIELTVIEGSMKSEKSAWKGESNPVACFP